MNTHDAILDEIAANGPSSRVKAVAKVVKGSNLGRPSKLSPKRAAIVLGYILDGASQATAARAAGIGKRTLQDWRARGAEWTKNGHSDGEIPAEEKVYIEFFAAMDLAEAQAELKLLKRAAAGEKGWQAAMTVLERKYPERWGRSEKRVHEGGDPEKPIAFELESDEERRRRVAKILHDTGAVNGQAQSEEA